MDKPGCSLMNKSSYNTIPKLKISMLLSMEPPYIISIHVQNMKIDKIGLVLDDDCTMIMVNYDHND